MLLLVFRHVRSTHSTFSGLKNSQIFALHPQLPRQRPFTVLALESSADDTCAAVITSDRQILSNVVVKQLDQHEVYGGIQPMVAIKAHQRNMPFAVRRALVEANLDMSGIDGIAFTRGPGIAGCLSVCSNAAKTLASALGKPVVGVHHMQAHALTAILTAPSFNHPTPTFPFLTLLVSGGHTLLLCAASSTDFRQLATTADESIGRAFDKVSRDLGLSWDGRGPGAALEKFVEDGETETRVLNEDQAAYPVLPPFPVPFPKKLAFSYSGLHSAVDRFLSTAQTALPDSERKTSTRPGSNLPHHIRHSLARAFQTAAVKQLEEKVILALRWCKEQANRDSAGDAVSDTRQAITERVKHVVVSGGVASNMFLRKRLKESIAAQFPGEDITLVFPPPSLCTDNAAMIGWASMHRFLGEDSDEYSIDHRPKWSIEDLTLQNI